MTVRNLLPKILVAGVVLWAGFFIVRGRDSQAPSFPVNANAAQAFILPLAETTYLPLRNFNISDPTVEAKAAGLLDLHSGKMLYAKNLDERLPIASITKLMTAVVVLENLPLNTTYVAAAEDLNVDGTGADLAKGERLKGGDLFKLMLIRSSNDAALVFAHSAAEQGINLVTKMNDKAKLLGMNDTQFADAAGLSDKDAYSTVDDLIKLARYVEKYPLIWETLITRTADITALDGQTHHLVSTDRLLDEIPNIIGGKTGFTDGALETMVLEVAINGGRDQLISVVLGSHDRFGETKKLLNWGLGAYRW